MTVSQLPSQPRAAVTAAIAATGRRRWIVVCLVAAALLATALQDPLGPAGYGVAYLAVVLGASAYAIAGARHRPRRDRPLVVPLAAGLALNGLGDLVWGIESQRGPVPDASAADVCYLAGLGLMCLALLRAVAGHRSCIDVDALIDVGTIGVVTVVLLWQTALADAAADGAGLGRAVLIAYPALDAVLIGLVVRLLWFAPTRAWSSGCVGLGLSCWLASDLSCLYLPLSDGDRWTALGWMLGASLMAHALSFRPVERPPVAGRSGLLVRLLVAIAPLAVPPVLLVVGGETARGRWPVILGATGVLIGLALLRTVRLLRAEEAARGALEAARDEALAAAQAKSDFLATMSHEMRTPLNGVLGLTSLLLHSGLAPRQRRWAEESARAGESLLRIINDVLDHATYDAGHLEIEELDLDVRQVIDDVCALARDHRSPARREDVAIEVAVDPRVPAVVRGDPHRLLQVLLNLLSNAVKFTPSGRIRLEVRLEGEGDAPGAPEGRPDEVELCFEVADTGIGIAAPDLQRMFEPFVQADSSSTRSYGGTGLGLAISRRLVEAMRGRLEVTSTLGEGSTFRVVLPVRLPPGALHAGRTRDVAPCPVGTGRTALVVHGDEIEQIVAEGVLRHLGFEVCVVGEAAAAAATLSRERFDLVLIEAGGDDVDGLDAARGEIPSIAIADEPRAHDCARRRGLGVVIDSPLDPDVVGRAVERVLSGSTALR